MASVALVRPKLWLTDNVWTSSCPYSESDCCRASSLIDTDVVYVFTARSDVDWQRAASSCSCSESVPQQQQQRQATRAVSLHCMTNISRLTLNSTSSRPLGLIIWTYFRCYLPLSQLSTTTYRHHLIDHHLWSFVNCFFSDQILYFHFIREVHVKSYYRRWNNSENDTNEGRYQLW